ncbi:MAG: hypothetical protein IPN06_20685 [Burkholderiales bacterium]|nr:hypothetical protein [Burkholderiales bacterium]
MKLSPAAVADLFKLLHEQRAAGHPAGGQGALPALHRATHAGFDVVRSGRYITYPLRARARAL